MRRTFSCTIAAAALALLSVGSSGAEEMTKERMDELVRKAREGGFEQSSDAMYRLRRAGKAAVPALLGLLESRNPRTRRTALACLEGLAEKAHAPKLMVFLDDPDPSVRYCAARVLLEMGHQPAVDRLLETMAKGGRNALVAADHIKAAGRAAVPGLLGLLEAPDRDTRMGAVRALQEIKAPEAAPAIARLMGDSDRLVRQDAIYALGELRYRPAAKRAIEIFKSDREVFRAVIVVPLAKMGDPAAIPLIRAYMKEAEARELPGAAEALCQLDCRYGVPVLIEDLKGEAASGLQADGILSDFTCAHKDDLFVDSAKRHKLWSDWWRANRDRSRLEWLIDALASPHRELRTRAAGHLKRIAGRDLGRSRERWQEWLRAEGAALKAEEDMSVFSAEAMAKAREAEAAARQRERAAGAAAGMAMTAGALLAIGSGLGEPGLRAAETIVAADPATVGSLVAMLSSPVKNTRCNAVVALESSRCMMGLVSGMGGAPPEALEGMKQAAKMIDDALAKVKRDEMKEYLLAAHKRRAAAGVKAGAGIGTMAFPMALGRYGGADAVEPLMENLRKVTEANRGACVIKWILIGGAAQALGMTGKEATVPILRELAATEDDDLKISLIKALGCTGDGRAVAHLMPYLGKGDVIASHTAGSLSMLTGKSFGFGPLQNTREGNRKALDEWRDWWEKEGKAKHGPGVKAD